YSVNIKNDTELLKNLVIYLDDLVGPRLVLGNRDEVSISIKGLVEESRVKMPNLPSAIVRPTPLGEASRRIIEILAEENLCFRILICGKEISLKDWLKFLKINFENFDYYWSERKLAKFNGVIDREIIIDKQVDLKFLRQTINWYRGNKDKFYFEENARVDEAVKTDKLLDKNQLNLDFSKKVSFLKDNFLRLFKRRIGLSTYQEKKNKKQFLWKKKVNFENFKILSSAININIKGSSALKKYSLFVFSALATLVLVPILSLASSFIFFYFGQSFLRKAHFDYAKYLFILQGKTADFSLPQFYFYSNIPFLGKHFEDFGRLANISSQTAEIAEIGIDVGQKVFSLIGKVVGGQEVPLDSYSKDIVLSLDVM
ncbi:MAG: hypothetical protein ACPLXL_01645, partial [Minisyncoccia bacterium]